MGMKIFSVLSLFITLAGSGRGCMMANVQKLLNLRLFGLHIY